MKVILFTTLLLFSKNGFAFNWEKVGKDINGSFFYVDIDNIKKHNGLVYYWGLTDLLEPKDSGTNSYIEKYKVNCEEEEQTWLNITFYSQPMGKGRIIQEITPKRIRYPKPNTVGYEQMKFACDYFK